MHEFNSFVTNEGKNLAKKIPNASTPFEYFVNKSDFVMETKPLSMNGLEDAFYSLKSNESPGMTILVIIKSKNALAVCVKL